MGEGEPTRAEQAAGVPETKYAKSGDINRPGREGTHKGLPLRRVSVSAKDAFPRKVALPGGGFGAPVEGDGTKVEQAVGDLGQARLLHEPAQSVGIRELLYGLR